MDTSEKRFQITAQSFAVDLLTWYLNAVHKGLAGPPSKKNKNPRSIITDCFQVRRPLTCVFFLLVDNF